MIPSVTALVSSVVGALVGGHIVRGVAREQMRRESDERRAERLQDKAYEFLQQHETLASEIATWSNDVRGWGEDGNRDRELEREYVRLCTQVRLVIHAEWRMDLEFALADYFKGCKNPEPQYRPSPTSKVLNPIFQNLINACQDRRKVLEKMLWGDIP